MNINFMDTFLSSFLTGRIGENSDVKFIWEDKIFLNRYFKINPLLRVNVAKKKNLGVKYQKLKEKKYSPNQQILINIFNYILYCYILTYIIFICIDYI